MQQRFLFADLIACSTCFGHHYALQEYYTVVAACGIVRKGVTCSLVGWAWEGPLSQLICLIHVDFARCVGRRLTVVCWFLCTWCVLGRGSSGSAGLTHIWKVAGFTGQTVDPTFVVGWNVSVGGWFCELCYCVAAFVTDFDATTTV